MKRNADNVFKPLYSAPGDKLKSYYKKVKRKPVKKSPRIPKSVRTLSMLADMIRHKFKIPCDKSTIKAWQKREVPFPSPLGENNTYIIKDCFAWVERYALKTNGKAADGELDLFKQSEVARMTMKITQAEREKLDLEKEKGLYVERSIAEQSMITAARAYHRLVRQEVEINSPSTRKEKLRELGASDEIMAKFHEWDIEQSRAVIDRIETRCANEGFDNE